MRKAELYYNVALERLESQDRRNHELELKSTWVMGFAASLAVFGPFTLWTQSTRNTQVLVDSRFGYNQIGRVVRQRVWHIAPDEWFDFPRGFELPPPLRTK